MTAASRTGCERTEQLAEYAMDALAVGERGAFEAHLSECGECREELEAVRWVLDAFADGPGDILQPSTGLWERLTVRIGVSPDRERASTAAGRVGAPEWPEWNEVAPGIFCSVLSTDEATNRLSMLVRLAPGVEYPPHTHAGIEELHLLDGELWINDRKLYPGDYSRAEPGTRDSRVWSETGCTCVLITSSRDILR